MSFKQLKPGEKIPANDYNRIGAAALGLPSPDYSLDRGTPLYGVSADTAPTYSIFGIYPHTPTEVNKEVPVVAIDAIGSGYKGGIHCLVTNGDRGAVADEPVYIENVAIGRPMKFRAGDTGFQMGHPCGPSYGSRSMWKDMPGFVALSEEWEESGVKYVWAMASPPNILRGTYNTTGPVWEVTGHNPIGSTTGTYELQKVFAWTTTPDNGDAVVYFPVIGYGWVASKLAGDYSFDVYWTSPNLYKVENGGTPEIVLTGVTC